MKEDNAAERVVRALEVELKELGSLQREIEIVTLRSSNKHDIATYQNGTRLCAARWHVVIVVNAPLG